MEIKIISKQDYQALYNVQLTEEEVDSINRYVFLEDYGIEIIEGTNLLEKDTLWLILSELNNKKDFPSRHNVEIIEKLKDLLYPKEEE